MSDQGVRIDRVSRYLVRFTNDAGMTREVAVLASNAAQAEERAMFFVEPSWFLAIGATQVDA